MGPLNGIKVLEFEAIGPAPFCGMMLADMGADVLLVDRPTDPQLGIGRDRWFDVLMRGRRSVTLDLKSPDAVVAARKLAARADVVLEGFRPGVMERLGLGPDDLLVDNPRLVYGRMTGWGQTGPLAPRAGHDINYIALSGVLNAIGRKDGPPVLPLNLVGDFGGGGMLLAFGIACALAERARSGKGQVVDAAMVEGASLLSTMFAGLLAAGRWSEARGENVLDSGAPWYDVYATRDDRYIAVGALEPRFYALLLAGLGLEAATLPSREDPANWPLLRKRFAEVFATRTRDEWTDIFGEVDACVSPVLSFTEAREHPHHVARGSHATIGGVAQPTPAPRFSRTPGKTRSGQPERGEAGYAAMKDWGFSAVEIAELRKLGTGCAPENSGG
jgi:alpha-methylacyl-CoA racemase